MEYRKTTKNQINENSACKNEYFSQILRIEVKYTNIYRKTAENQLDTVQTRSKSIFGMKHTIKSNSKNRD